MEEAPVHLVSYSSPLRSLLFPYMRMLVDDYPHNGIQQRVFNQRKTSPTLSPINNIPYLDSSSNQTKQGSKPKCQFLVQLKLCDLSTRKLFTPSPYFSQHHCLSVPPFITLLLNASKFRGIEVRANERETFFF